MKKGPLKAPFLWAGEVSVLAGLYGDQFDMGDRQKTKGIKDKGQHEITDCEDKIEGELKVGLGALPFLPHDSEGKLIRDPEKLKKLAEAILTTEERAWTG